jgi:3-deoxy-manno-octulosonate cytidylyltransferase (CMP-KDO synthetase)
MNLNKNRPHVIGIIPARFGSTRFPGKPLVKIGSKSMIQWTYESASQADCLTEIIVATDDDRIYQEVIRFGGRAVLTRQDHPTGTDRLIEVTEKLLDLDVNLEVHRDIVVNIQGDEPGIEASLIQGVVDLKIRHPEWVVTTACVPMNWTDAQDPNRVKVVFNSQNKALYFSRALIPSDFKKDALVDLTQGGGILYYRHLGIYCYNMDFLLSYNSLPSSNWEALESLEQLRVLQNGYDMGIFQAKKASLAIDRPEDVSIVEDEFRTQGKL